MGDTPEKPEYFANGDFQDTVASIIASPRKSRTINGISSEAAARLYEMSDKQRDYYKKCFGQLMKASQGQIDEDGSLWGGDTIVVDFFRKSLLDNEELSRIWSMADVNADGWLDVAEFAVAMHLIVLHVKGGLEIPDCLPMHLRPPLSCPRSPPPSWNGVGRQVGNNFDESSSSSTTTVVHSHHPSSSIVSASFHAPPPHSQSAEALHLNPKIDAPVAHFSDVPPLLVDGRPTAIRTSQPIVPTPTPTEDVKRDTAALLLSLKSPMGPPPQPPPRPAARGHGRSASLDLKVMSTVPLANPSLHPASSFVPSSTVPTTSSTPSPPSSSSSHPHPTSFFRPISSSLTTTTSAAVNQTFKVPELPARPAKTPVPACPSTLTTVPPTTTMTSSGGQSMVIERVATTVAAPGTSLVSPPIAPRKRTVETQTEVPYTSREEFEHFIKEFISHRDDLLGGDMSGLLDQLPTEGKSPAEKWAERCEVLRRQNAELERQLATISQVRVQLELRLQELEESNQQRPSNV